MRGFLVALAVTIVFTEAPRAEACSPAPTSIHEQFTKHSRVFLGTVRAPARAPSGAYELTVDEPFKGFEADTAKPASLTVTFNIRGQCGFDAPKPGTRVLVFMNEGDVVSLTSGSRFIWSESAQSAPHLNPVWDDVILLRAMLRSGPVVPDAETAVHLALETLLPLMGAEALSKRLPLAAEFMADGKTYEERVWRVRGKAGAPLVELNKMNGQVVRVRLEP